MNRKLLIIGLVLLLGVGGYFAYSAMQDDTQEAASTQQTEQPTEEDSDPFIQQDDLIEFEFADPKKSAHYVSNTPEHAAVLENVPDEVTLTFDFDLSNASTVTVTKDGQEVSTGDEEISPDRLNLSKSLDTSAGSGLYTVVYNACWPDGSCHDGQFQFGVL